MFALDHEWSRTPVTRRAIWTASEDVPRVFSSASQCFTVGWDWFVYAVVSTGKRDSYVSIMLTESLLLWLSFELPISLYINRDEKSHYWDPNFNHLPVLYMIQEAQFSYHYHVQLIIKFSWNEYIKSLHTTAESCKGASIFDTLCLNQFFQLM